MTALVILIVVGVVIYAATRNRRSRPQPHATPLVDRVDFLERRVSELQAALDTLRGAAPEPAPEPTRAPAAQPPRPMPAPTPPPPERTPAPTPAPRVAPSAPPRPPSFDWGRTVSAADLMGAKALAFAGVFFEGPEAAHWRKRGLVLLERERAEQVLADGGHFERSPMYHAIVASDLLDLAALASVFPEVLPRDDVARWRTTAGAMLR